MKACKQTNSQTIYYQNINDCLLIRLFTCFLPSSYWSNKQAQMIIVRPFIQNWGYNLVLLFLYLTIFAIYSSFLLPSFFRIEENNKSRGQKSCLSARSIIWYLSLKIRLLIWLCTAGENIIGEPKIQNKFWCTKKMF